MGVPVEQSEIVGRIKRIVAAESQISSGADSLPDTTPLTGGVLRINSLAMLGMLVKLEDELGVQLPDDLLLGRRFKTLGDIISAVLTALRAPQ